MFATVTKKLAETQRTSFDAEPATHIKSLTKSTILNMETESMNTNLTPSTQQSTVFSEDTELRGALSFTTKMEFNGRFEGDVAASGPLIMGEKAVVKADIQSTSSVVIYGKVKGNITAKDKVELGPKAHLYGDVHSPKFMISEGAIFIGRADTLDGGAKPSDEFNNLFKRLGANGGSSKSHIDSDKK